ncbi:MAG: GDSL-type esterase/lipase family protein [Bacteroidota bacterium]
MTVFGTPRSVLLLFWCLTGFQVPAIPETAPPTPVHSRYPFIRDDLNLIDNNFRGLRHFYSQLEKLERGQTRQVRILHIGDSHIQADWFSGRLRLALQKRYGSAGRGLVFPYRVAKTNSPSDILSSSDAVWQAKRNISVENPLPIGVSGITIQTRTPDYQLEVALGPNQAHIDYTFDKVTVFANTDASSFRWISPQGQIQGLPTAISQPARRSPDPAPKPRSVPPPKPQTKKTYHEVKTGETLGIIAAKYRVPIKKLQELNGIEGSQIFAGQKLVVRESKILAEPATPVFTKNVNPVFNVNEPHLTHFEVEMDRPGTRVVLEGKRTDRQQSQATLYGMVLENSQERGILYHMVGVNGAKFEHYNAAQLFLEQVQTLDPDLIIISLGTNESIGGGFSRQAFFDELDTFVHGLEQFLPHADILLTTPPDAIGYGGRPVGNVQRARDVLLQYALNNDLSCWNFYDIMGGSGSMEDWHGAGLAQRDRLHLSPSGYFLQGDMLYEALNQGYAAFRTAR